MKPNRKWYFRCWLGWHAWRLPTLTEAGFWENSKWFLSRRICRKCGKDQKHDGHEWKDVPRP